MRKLIEYVYYQTNIHLHAAIFTIIYFIITFVISWLIAIAFNISNIWIVLNWIIISGLLSFRVNFIMDKMDNLVDKYLDS